MRTTIIGIIIGIVFGVMIGATIVAPGLEDARHAATNDPNMADAEGLDLVSSDTLGLVVTSDTPAIKLIDFIPTGTPILGKLSKKFAHTLILNSNGRLYAQHHASGTLIPTTDT